MRTPVMATAQTLERKQMADQAVAEEVKEETRSEAELLGAKIDEIQKKYLVENGLLEEEAATESVAKHAEKPKKEPESEPAAELIDEPEKSDEKDETAVDNAEIEAQDDTQSELAALAELYQMNPDELSGFKSAEEAQAYLAFADKRLARSQVPQHEAAMQSQPSNGQPAQPGDKTQQLADDLKLDLSDLPEDDPIRKSLSALANYVSSLAPRLKDTEQVLYGQVQATFAQQQAQAVADFHGSLDRLDAERFGKGSKISAVQKANRAKLQDEVYTLAVAMRTRGNQVPNLDNMITRADRSLFFTDILKEQEKKRAATPRAKMGSPTRGTKPAEPSLEEWDAKGKKWSDHPALSREVEKRMRRTE